MKRIFSLFCRVTPDKTLNVAEASEGKGTNGNIERPRTMRQKRQLDSKTRNSLVGIKQAARK